jgi:acyl-CoA thioester hydrolase
MEKSKFKFKSQVSVRNYEIDWQGIVHNTNYLLYFEVGRMAYLEKLGVKVDLNSIQHESKIVVARNEIDYFSAARFGEIIDIYMRISFIRNTSFAFEGILEDSKGHRPIAENTCIHVWLDQRTNQPTPVSDSFRKLVQEYEGKNVSITWPTYLV